MSLGLKNQLPCDVHMLNLRSIFKSGHREAALLLHRKGFDCGFSTRPLTCILTNGQVNSTLPYTQAHTHTCTHVQITHACTYNNTHTSTHRGLDSLQYHSTGGSEGDIQQFPIIISENNTNNDVSC